MRTDCNPSVIFGLYSKPDKVNQFIEFCKNKGVGLREIRFFDVEIPLDKNYNKLINEFKEFIMWEYWQDRNPLFMDGKKIMGIDIKDKMINILKEKVGYEPVMFNKSKWEHSRRHELLWSLAVPLLVQDQTKNCETEEELKYMEMLKTFDSEGYLNDEEKRMQKRFESLEEGENGKM